MKCHAVVVLASVLLVGADAPSDALKKETEKLQGTWAAVSAEGNGEKAPEEAIKDFRIVIEGNSIIFNPKTQKRESTFELDLTKTPKEIVLTPTDGPRKGKPVRGIYTFEDEILKLCINNDQNKQSGKAPTEFATKPGDGLAVLTLKRQEPEKKDGP